MSLYMLISIWIRQISSICYIIYPYLYTITILCLLISLYRLYKKQITYKEIPKFFTIFAMLFDLYFLIVYFRQNKREYSAVNSSNIVFPLLIIQLCAEGIVILVYFYNLTRGKLYFFIPITILFAGFVWIVQHFISIKTFLRKYASLGSSFVYVGAIENEWAIRESKNGFGIPIEMTVSFIIYNIVYLFMLYERHHVKEIYYFGCVLGIGANMDLFFTYVKTISKDIEGTIIKEGEKQKEKEQEPKEESIAINAINSVEEKSIEENLINSQV